MRGDRTYCTLECSVSDSCARHLTADEPRNDAKGELLWYVSEHTGETCELYETKGEKQ